MKRNFENKCKYRRLSALALAIVMLMGLAACSPAPKAAAPVAEAEKLAPTPVPTPAPTPEPTPEPVNGELLLDEDGDGIINYKFTYKGATVYALIVLDPGRVFVGTAIQDNSVFYGLGKTLDELAEQYGAAGGINAGGFIDYDGGGSGWPPYGITINEGVCYNAEEMGPIAGMDRDDELWVGWYSYEECVDLGLRSCVSFGPVLVRNGEKTPAEELETGIGARTAIGQRLDGAIVMVAIDGRQAYSIGVTFPELVDIMCDKFGCVNAVNMDGGNSTCMYYNGELVNNSSNQAGGTRYLPDAWLIKGMTADYVKPDSVPERIVLPWDALGELKGEKTLCDEEMSGRICDFAVSFIEAYYGFFGTSNADYYYPTLLQYVAPECELRWRAEQALLDRLWVNTYRNSFEEIRFLGAYDNGDGTYTAELGIDMTEYANYWTYRALDTQLSITLYEEPDSWYGFYVTETD